MKNKTKTIQLFVFALMFFGCFAFAQSASADYYNQGVLKSKNMLSGARNVTAILSADVEVDVPASTTASIGFSQNRNDFYSSAGVEGEWDALADGANNVDLTGLSWTEAILYYKVKLETTDASATPAVLEVEINYTGDAVPAITGTTYSLQGAFVSKDLLANTSSQFRNPAHFAYNISYLPAGATVSAQFSQDGTTWYDSTGTAWAADNLSEGIYLTKETALSLAGLSWDGAEEFYYKISYTLIDEAWSPVVDDAGVLFDNVQMGGNDDTSWMNTGLVGHWKMDEASWNGTADEVVDASGNGNHGVRAGDATTAAGKFGKGGTFDGDGDYIEAGTGALGIDEKITVSVWVYRSGSPTGTYPYIFSKHSGAVSGGAPYDMGYGIGCDSDGDTIRFVLVNETDGLNKVNIIDSQTISNGIWYHFVGTYDGVNAHLYRNGELIGSQSASGEVYDYFGDYNRIGRYQRSNGNGYWNGMTDEVRIYNRALSQDEVKKLYEWAPGPVLHLKMDEKVSGDAKTLYDISGNGNNGTTEDGANNTGMDCAVLGKYGSGCEFDGVDDYVSLSNKLSGTVGTISLWVKPSYNSPAEDYFFHYLFDTSIEVGRYLVMYNKNSHSYELYIGGTLITNDINLDHNTGELFYLTVIWNTVDDDYYVYKNGVLIYSNLLTDATATNPTTLFLGTKFDANECFNGLIDDVRIYDYARTPAQILADMNGGQAKAVNSPILDLDFDEGFGAAARNKGIGGASLNGTLTPGAGGTNTTVTQMWSLSGKNGRAVEFDGTDDYVSAPDFGY